MKKAAICFLMVLVMSSLAACTKHSGQNMSENRIESEIESAKEVSSESEGTDEAVMSLTDVEVSNKSAIVSYAGENFVKSVFAVGNTMLYVCGIKADDEYFYGCMQKEEDIFKEFTMEMDEGMRAFNMVVDEQGRCHILWMSVEKYEEGDQK